ncbi:hypothetical protein EV175_006565, partial [Coemansia sp. RSA 1933]
MPSSGNGGSVAKMKKSLVFSSDSSSDSDNEPLAMRGQQGRHAWKGSSDSDNEPLAKRSQTARSKRKPMDGGDSSDSESDVPLSSKSKVPKIALPNGLVLPKTAAMAAALRQKPAKQDNGDGSGPKTIKKEKP